MQQVTVGTKYQIVIPKEIRKKIKDFKPGSKVSIGVMGKNSVAIHTNPKSWVESSRGIAKEAWKNIDTTAYLDKLRDEWHEK